jgi:hypothetical protein
LKTQLQDQPLAAEAPNALSTLAAGQPFVGLVADLPEAERSMLGEQGIVNLLILPTFSAGSFWGFMGFDDCRPLRSGLSSTPSGSPSARKSPAAPICRGRWTRTP